MIPQERELVANLFDRLAALEAQPRDSEAEQLIKEGLRRAPNAVYALVQSVLVQDEALRRADARIRELEGEEVQGEADREPRSFLDNMRDALLGERRPERGAVPEAPASTRPMGVPPQFGTRMSAPGEPPPSAPTQDAPSRGGSFLGTAAAAAAGAIGGALLLDGIRSMLGGQQQGPFAGTFDRIAGEPRAPWGDSGSAQTAGLAGARDEPASLFDASADANDADFDDDLGDFDGGSEDV
jgi:hypothetical protein